jgi:hypothetical protein
MGLPANTLLCWDVMRDETYRQRDYTPIDKNELLILMRYLGVEP